jgi:nitric oxide reductase activation protein
LPIARPGLKEPRRRQEGKPDQHSAHDGDQVSDVHRDDPGCLGAAIRHAAKAIDTRAGAGHRLLLVLSDGVAFDHGYEGNHADSDARMALLEARRRQIGCLSLSVGVEHNDTRLRDTFGAPDYLRFGSWDALRADLAPLLRNAIRVSR